MCWIDSLVISSRVLLAAKLQLRSQSLRTWVAERSIGCKESCKNKTKHLYFVRQIKHIKMFSSIFFLAMTSNIFKTKVKIPGNKKIMRKYFFLENVKSSWTLKFQKLTFSVEDKKLAGSCHFWFHTSRFCSLTHSKVFNMKQVIKKHTMVVVLQVIGMMVAHNRGVWG